MKYLFLTIMAMVVSSTVVNAQTQKIGGYAPTYPCTEYSFDSSCAKFPYMAPPAEIVTSGILVKCELKTNDFSSISTQRQEMQQSCVYGECTPVGYGFTWYLTRRELSTKDAPRILFTTQNFVKDPSQLDSQEVTVSFNSAQSFFDYSDESSAGINALNSETSRINSQIFNVSIKDLLAGYSRKIKVGVLTEDKEVKYIDADISCSAKR